MVSFFQETRLRLSDLYHEARFGVRTVGTVPLATLGLADPDFVDSMPMAYRHIFKMLAKVPIPASEVVFLDYGIGKGRAVVAASAMPYRTVLGVEISEVLLDAARNNLNRMKGRRVRDVRLFHANAADFVVPDEVNLIYFYNPFRGRVLDQVIDRIHDSHATRPRDIYIVFLNNDDFEARIAGKPWKRIYHTRLYPDYSCGIYRVR